MPKCPWVKSWHIGHIMCPTFPCALHANVPLYPLRPSSGSKRCHGGHKLPFRRAGQPARAGTPSGVPNPSPTSNPQECLILALLILLVITRTLTLTLTLSLTLTLPWPEVHALCCCLRNTRREATATRPPQHFQGTLGAATSAHAVVPPPQRHASATWRPAPTHPSSFCKKKSRNRYHL